MKSNPIIAPEKKKSVHALEATNFFLADVQTGLGPFLAAYLAGAGWQLGRVGMALTIGGIITARAKFWGEAEVVKATAHLGGQTFPMKRIDNSRVWQADVSAPLDGVHSLKVSAEDARGNVATDEIRVVSGDLAERERAERDQDNALEAWPEHGLLGTQLGPDKNGKRW